MISAIVHLSHSLEGPFVIAHRSTTRYPKKTIDAEVDELSQVMKGMRLHAMQAKWMDSELVFTPRNTIRIHDTRGDRSPHERCQELNPIYKCNESPKEAKPIDNRREGFSSLLHWIDMPFDRSICYQDIVDFLQITWCTVRNVQFLTEHGTKRLSTHRVRKHDVILLTSGYTIVSHSNDTNDKKETIRVRPCHTLRFRANPSG